MVYTWLLPDALLAHANSYPFGKVMGHDTKSTHMRTCRKKALQH
jgi:hypothetical protein